MNPKKATKKKLTKRAAKKKAKTAKKTAANVGYEAKLWQMADALRNNMDAAEYKHVVLGLIFLKYISDAFESKHAELESQQAEGADPEYHWQAKRSKTKLFTVRANLPRWVYRSRKAMIFPPTSGCQAFRTLRIGSLENQLICTSSSPSV